MCDKENFRSRSCGQTTRPLQRGHVGMKKCKKERGVYSQGWEGTVQDALLIQ